MRQAIFIVVLIGAAFLGGAFINGPGLQWIQSHVLRSLGLNNDGEIAAVDLESNSSGEIGFAPDEPAKPSLALKAGAIVPMPAIEPKGNTPKKDTSKSPLAIRPKGESRKARSGSDQSREPSLPSDSQLNLVTKSGSDTASQVRSKENSVRDDSLAQASHSAPRKATSETPALLDSLAALLPSDATSANASERSIAHHSAGSTPPPVRGDQWALLESRMQTFGVSRFTIEGKPGGPIVFACLIPVAGRQAVAERFEAEGDDVVQAARAVLQRIILWRAAQSPGADRANSVSNTER